MQLRRVLSDHVADVTGALASSHYVAIKNTLRLLVALAGLGSAAATALLNAVDLTIPAFKACAAAIRRPLMASRALAAGAML